MENSNNWLVVCDRAGDISYYFACELDWYLSLPPEEVYEVIHLNLPAQLARELAGDYNNELMALMSCGAIV